MKFEEYVKKREVMEKNLRAKQNEIQDFVKKEQEKFKDHKLFKEFEALRKEVEEFDNKAVEKFGVSQNSTVTLDGIRKLVEVCVEDFLSVKDE